MFKRPLLRIGLVSFMLLLVAASTLAALSFTPLEADMGSEPISGTSAEWNASIPNRQAEAPPVSGNEKAPRGPQSEPPATLVSDNVAYMTIADAKVWWWYAEGCAPTVAADPAAATDIPVEEIARIATTGGIIRTIFLHEVPNLFCGSWEYEVLSNVAADSQYLYWMSAAEDGLVKLSVEANVGDPAIPLYTGQSLADEIEDFGDYVYLMDDAYGIIRVNKLSGVGAPIVSAAQLGGSSGDLQITNPYVFWNKGGVLKVAASSGGAVDNIQTGVTGFVAEEPTDICLPGFCSRYVFLATGSQIRRYNLDTQTLSGVLYESPIDGAEVVELAVDDDYIYFFEQRQAACDPFCRYDYGLYRIPRVGGAADLLHFVTNQMTSGMNFDLTLGGLDDDYLFWHDQAQLRRLPRDAAAIEAVDVFVTDIEVTQAIQDLNNSIQLIQGKRTGARVHVDAAGQNVAGISARLFRLNSSGVIVDGPIYPSGPSYLTVQNNPNRASFDHAFYFELPHDWITGGNLRLRAQVNASQLPPEPNYSNNVQNTATLALRPSPTLRGHLIRWVYTVEVQGEDVSYIPRLVEDVYQARSWIRRAYPLASTTGDYYSPDPGFRLAIRMIYDPTLGERVLRTAAPCLLMPVEEREFCAINHTNNHAKLLRITEEIPFNEVIYGMIRNEPPLPGMGGRASGSVSSGATGEISGWTWDDDGSYGDRLMGHEMAHNLGRHHPLPVSDNPATPNILEGCGHGGTLDFNFPHANAAIGVGDMWGFDVGDPGLGAASLQPRVYSNATWRDVLSYCDFAWISDYNYEGLYDVMSFLSPFAARATGGPARAGEDYIALFGMIYGSSNTAAFDIVGLWDSPGPYTPPSSGAYRMRFLDSNGNELAAHDFDGDAHDSGSSVVGFSVVVPYPATTSKVELVRKRDDKLLATHLISANAPSISNVQLSGAPNPVTGTITLQWQAADEDGDPLSFDVYYSDDNGATYKAYALALSTTSVQLDTGQMGGSAQARFRVIANDGTRTAEAESAPFTMANKPPTVVILTPQDGLEVTYGATINFTAEVEDLQGHIPNSNMQWYVNGIATGIFGPNYTAYLLPVGTNEISLRAVNSRRQAAEGIVSVIVNDDLEYPGPTLGVGPDQVGWQVAEGTVDLQQATLTISNIGAGLLNWTAGEDATWLSISTRGGSTPGTLTIMADPTKVTPRNPVSTLLTISGDNGQTVQLSVNMLVGPSPAWFPSTGYEIFLPVSLR